MPVACLQFVTFDAQNNQGGSPEPFSPATIMLVVWLLVWVISTREELSTNCAFSSTR